MIYRRINVKALDLSQWQIMMRLLLLFNHWMDILLEIEYCKWASKPTRQRLHKMSQYQQDVNWNEMLPTNQEKLYKKQTKTKKHFELRKADFHIISSLISLNFFFFLLIFHLCFNFFHNVQIFNKKTNSYLINYYIRCPSQ